MKISIVTAYYNRRQLFINTLKSIEKSKYKDLVEIIVVDDNSNEQNRIEDLPELFNLDIKVIRIEEKDKTWMNPCVPFNIGFKQASNEIVILQNPECLHIGDVIDFTFNNIKENVYLNFACYSINGELTDKVSNYNFDNYDNINNLLQPMVNRPVGIDGETAWYNHSIYRPHKLHFCSAIMKSDLDDLGGFDERFANGIAYDDNEFLLRIQRKGMEVKVIDSPFVIHQFHGITQYGQKQEYVNKNYMLYKHVLVNEKNYKVN